ncbi:VCBS repeat-containing protein [Fulvivirgaceae bacterium PWU20]|uniref:VCBS repeat-containing protein n=2 Tax=Chryseosolibacter indicus TaxID=2782351 RepID=A0ABS5VPY1_9BACT|nr:VCBS repeat-containing protein [Chryseosolibacter indicus]
MNINRSIVIVFLFLIFLTSCDNQKQLFQKLESSDSGITFKNKLTPSTDLNIIDYLYFYNGGGVAVGDINGDDLPDLYFSGNQVPNKLYLNKGNLKFEDITDKAGVSGNNTWDTGSVMGDVNGDGLLDIYVCAVVGLKNLKGHNELFINNGDYTFSEKSAEYGLDFESYSSSAAFLDYDLDGDLDIYLLNHAIHTPGSFGHANLRNVRTYETGGKLLRNEEGKFVDVSEEAKIYGGINGYGLGIAISDFNLDGYPDIYVGNDFHEDDYYYVNNGDGTFSEQGKHALTATSKFSMGNDAADINHDGYPDLISLDMLPEDEAVLKRSVDEENINLLRMRIDRYGYNYQFPRNMLQINQGNGQFSETALMSNVAATDWSWSALFSDFDQDGNQDLFISNGIPRRPNDLDYIKYVSSEQVVNVIGTTKLADEKALSLMPSGMVQNYIFKGNGSYQFEDKSAKWLPDEKTCSTATAYADLDNDGDLDLVINNVDDTPGVYINQTNESANYLKLKLKYGKENTLGIGTRVYSYQGGVMQLKEMYTIRGFQASSEPIIHFGYGNSLVVDSIKIIWPNGQGQKLVKVKVNQTLVISPDNKKEIIKLGSTKSVKPIFAEVDPAQIGLTFKHVEDSYTDFDRLKLLPYQQSDRGPATAIGDINNDGQLDIYFGGSKHIPGQFYIQSGNGFIKTHIPDILKDSVKEDIDAAIADFNKDGKTDLFIGTGGADFFNKARPLLDSYYKSLDGGFALNEVADYYENASCVKQYDFNNDGDLDIFVGNESVSDDFGKVPQSYLLVNDKGVFTAFQKELFEGLGMVTDALWEDYNKDGKIDLIVVGEWMKPLFLKNSGNSFEKDNVLDTPLNGLWQSIASFDIDSDGDTDYILGNWGLNSKFKASESHPMKMYYHDFDENGKSETIIAIEKHGNYYPLDGFDVIASQIPALRKKYNSYQAFAGKKVEEIFTSKQLHKSQVYEVHQLASGYLKNDNGKYTFIPFPMDLQTAPLMAQLKYDFDADGRNEVLLGGNYFGVQPFHGRFASFPGALVKSDKDIVDGNSIGLNLINHSVRHLNIITVKNNTYLLVTINNGSAQIYNLLK